MKRIKIVKFFLLMIIVASFSLSSLPIRKVLCFSSGYERFVHPTGTWEAYVEYMPLVPFNPNQSTASEEFALRFQFRQEVYWEFPIKYVPGGFLIAVYLWDECGNSSWPTWKRWYPIDVQQLGTIVTWSLKSDVGDLGLSAPIASPTPISLIETNLNEYPFTPPPPFNDTRTYVHMGALEIVYNCNSGWGQTTAEGAGCLGIPNDLAISHEGHHVELLVELWSF
jgi:hypothetical protein